MLSRGLTPWYLAELHPSNINAQQYRENISGGHQDWSWSAKGPPEVSHVGAGYSPQEDQAYDRENKSQESGEDQYLVHGVDSNHQQRDGGNEE